eukprot:6174132-Pleurochrysis_carterae.AAC.2
MTRREELLEVCAQKDMHDIHITSMCLPGPCAQWHVLLGPMLPGRGGEKAPDKNGSIVLPEPSADAACLSTLRATCAVDDRILNRQRRCQLPARGIEQGH